MAFGSTTDCNLLIFFDYLHIPSASESKALASSLDIPKIPCTFNGSTYPWSSAASYSFDASIYSIDIETMSHGLVIFRFRLTRAHPMDGITWGIVALSP